MEMRCSRVALSLLLAVLGCAVIALNPADGRRGVAADIGPAPSSSLGLEGVPDESNGAYDWGQDEYGYVHTSPQSETGEGQQEDDWTATDQGEYTGDDASEQAYDFEDEYGDDDYLYTDDTAADPKEYVYNDDEDPDDQTADDEQVDDESDNEVGDQMDDEYDDEVDDQQDDVYDDGMNEDDGDFSGDYSNDEADDEYFTTPGGGLDVQRDDDPDGDIHDTDDEVIYDEYDDEMDDQIDDETSDQVDDGMDDETNDGTEDEIDEEVYDEMNGEVNDNADDSDEEMDDQTADEGEGYSYQYAYPDEQYGYSETAEKDCQPIIEPADETEAGQSDYSYDDEYGYTDDYYDDWTETANEAEGAWTADDQEAAETDVQSNPTECDYGQYECWDGESSDVSDEDLDAESTDCEYDEPFDFYGECYNVEPLPATGKQGLELFAWQPADLLLSTDRDLLQSLERLCEEPSGVRRAELNEYIESLGMEAIDFATRFEDATGTEVLGLVDDLPGCAAFLGSFRLLEKGELDVEEAIGVLRKSLAGLSRQWIEGVSEITSHAFDVTPEDQFRTTSGRPLFGTVISLAAESLDDLGGAICRLSRRLDELKWRF